jgi:hypothetical protein
MSLPSTLPRDFDFAFVLCKTVWISPRLWVSERDSASRHVPFRVLVPVVRLLMA